MASILNADTSNGLVLTSDTSGEIKLQSAGADIATVTSSGITMASGKTLPASALTGSLPAIDGSSLTNLPGGGKILQVVQTVKSDTFTTTNQGFIDIPGLSVSITPSSTSSKILVLCDLKYGIDASMGAAPRLLRVGAPAPLYVGNTAGSRPGALGQEVTATTLQTSGGVYLDSPATTSAITYKTIFANSGGTGDIGFNTYANSSGITLMEIAG